MFGHVFCTKGTDVHSECTYSCAPGYELGNGTSTRTCELDGESATWSGNASTCSIAHCPSLLSKLKHDSVYCTGTEFGSYCIYACSAGFRLKGPSVIRACKLSGNYVNWTGSEPKCERIRCSSLASPPNGHLLCDNKPGTNGVREVGSLCKYSCSSDYRLHGLSSTRICIPTGNSAVWTGSRPTCIGTRCSLLPPNITNGNISCPYSTDVNSTCNYSCLDGYELSGGNSTLTCQLISNETIANWTGSVPTCKLIPEEVTTFAPSTIVTVPERKFKTTTMVTDEIMLTMSTFFTTTVLDTSTTRTVTEPDFITEGVTNTANPTTEGFSDVLSNKGFLSANRIILYVIVIGIGVLGLVVLPGLMAYLKYRRPKSSEEKYQIPRALPVVPTKTATVVTCRDVDDDLQDLKVDLSKDALIIDNTYESIAHLLRSDETDRPLKTGIHGADQAEVIPEEGSVNNQETSCKKINDKNDEKNPTATVSLNPATGKTSFHKRKVSADVHQASPASPKDGKPVKLNLERDEQEYMIPEMSVENSYTPLHAKIVPNDSPSRNPPPIAENESAKKKPRIEHEYLVPDLEDAASSMDLLETCDGEYSDTLPNDPGYESAIKKTYQVIRPDSSEVALVVSPDTAATEELYESMDVADDGAALQEEETQDEQLYEEAYDVDKNAITKLNDQQSEFRKSLLTTSGQDSEIEALIAVTNDDEIYETPI